MANTLSGQALHRSEDLPPKAEATRARWVLVAFLVSLLLAALPVLTTRVPPIGDYLGHLARIYVIDYAARDPLIASFYEVHWRIIPNLAFDLVVSPLAQVVGLYAAGRLYILLYLGLILGGVHAIHWALFRRWSFGPLVGVLFLYSQIHLFGLVNYVFGLGIALWAIAAFILLSNAAWWQRVLVSLIFVTVLFFCHLFALGLYGLTLLAIELAWAWRERPSARRLAGEAAVFLAPFLVALPLMALSPTTDFVAVTHWTLWSKAQGFILAIKTYNSGLDLAAAVLIAAGTFWGWRQRILRVHPAGIALVAVAAPVYLAMPLDLLSAWGADIRLPIAVLIILVGFIEWRFRSLAQEVGFVVAVALIACLRIGVVEVAWQEITHHGAEMERAMQSIPRGSKILVAVVDHPRGNYAVGEAILGMPVRAIIERSSFVSAEFTHPGQQVLAARANVRDLASDFYQPPTVTEMLTGHPGDPERAAKFRRIYWKDWPERFDFVYLLLTRPGEANPAPDRLQLAYEGDLFQLYRVRRPER
jgi:hypothetical protein